MGKHVTLPHFLKLIHELAWRGHPVGRRKKEGPLIFRVQLQRRSLAFVGRCILEGFSGVMKRTEVANHQLRC